MDMLDYKRALYDFSAAIRAETKQKSKVPQFAKLVDYYCKLL